jgi:transcriptional regulator with XRE-family HTH domain
MISDTLSAGLQQYGIGTKLRMLGLRKKLGLVELGRHTGMSAAMLSKIERGLLFPTLPTLLRIALVFGVGLEFFFGQDTTRPRVAVIRKRDRLLLPDCPGRLRASISPSPNVRSMRSMPSSRAMPLRPNCIATMVPS